MLITLLRALSATVLIYLLVRMAFLKLESNHKSVKDSIVYQALKAQDAGMIDGQYKDLGKAIGVVDTAKECYKEGCEGFNTLIWQQHEQPVLCIILHSTTHNANHYCNYEEQTWREEIEQHHRLNCFFNVHNNRILFQVDLYLISAD